MIDYETYTYRVIWSEEDNEFVGLCDQFHSLSYLNENENKALEGIKKLVKRVLIDMNNNDFKSMSKVELRAYVISHPNDMLVRGKKNMSEFIHEAVREKLERERLNDDINRT